MKSASRTIIEFIGLGLSAVILAITVNAVRGDGAIKLTKNYFDIGNVPISPRAAAPIKSDNTQANVDSAPAVNVPSENSAPTEEHLNHRYQKIAFEEVMALYNDPLTSSGLNVFVDARNEEHFSEGHIPGALLCNPYQVERRIDDIIDRVKNAEKIVVYCGGGKCEDSIFMCRELINLEIPYDCIYLYEGGWKEWEAGSGPVEKESP